MSILAVRASCCCLCWIDGIQSKTVDNWPGFPICHEHLEASLERTHTSFDMEPRPAIAANVIDLAEMRQRLRPVSAPKKLLR